MAATEANFTKLALAGHLLLKHSCNDYHENVSDCVVAVGRRRSVVASMEASLIT